MYEQLLISLIPAVLAVPGAFIGRDAGQIAGQDRISVAPNASPAGPAPIVTPSRGGAPVARARSA